MTSSPHPRTALSVNVNKVALVRNTRHLGIPSVTRAALLCLQAGAQGITVHPRPDERHIRPQDVHELAELLQAWPGASTTSKATHAEPDGLHPPRAPHQATFVPDSEDQFTSDHGWSFPQDAARLAPLIAECQGLGVRVSLFMDPVPSRWPGPGRGRRPRGAVHRALRRRLGPERQAAELERYRPPPRPRWTPGWASMPAMT
jgi:pyridoxine 5-phosphate synthase